MRRAHWLLIAALPAVFVLGIVAFVLTRAQHSLNRAGTAVAGEGRFPFEMRTLGRIENPGFEAIASPATYTSGAFFQGKLFVSGPSGLFVYGDSAAGVGVSLLKSYRVGLDLPAAPLGALAVGRLRGASEPELMIATSGAGVLFFSGNANEAKAGGVFRQLLPADRDARDITALLPLPTGELLVGTRRRGVLIFHGAILHGASLHGNADDSRQAEGDALEVFHPRLANLAVTALAGDATGFWVGTQDRGVLHCHGGQIDGFNGAPGAAANATAASLPDAHVDAIAVDGGRVFVGTPMGVEEFDDGLPARTLAKDVFVHALYADRKAVTIGSMDEGIRQVSLETSRRHGVMRAGFAMDASDIAGPVEQFVRGANDGAGSALYAVMRDGVRMQRGSGWVTLAADDDRAKTAGGGTLNATLTDGNISALAVGADGRLWVGYFDRGLDVLSPVGGRRQGSAYLERTGHLEDDRIFCVNRIALDPQRKTMAVATANGLVLMDAQGKERQVMTQRDGLIADHVTDVAFRGGSMVLATPAGITFVDASGTQSLYAFHGLVNNHVYALGVRGDSRDDEILAGTLGGISDLVHESVRRNYTVSNSGLKHNWVTAIVPAGGLEDGTDWMAGTYGAGVMRIDKDGRFSAMDGVTRDMIVNPNAMLATDRHILVGTLGQGMWVWSKATGRWRQITAGLPSENVTAFTEDSGEVYVGTENGLVRIAERLLD